jgi:hypothetical protein
MAQEYRRAKYRNRLNDQPTWSIRRRRSGIDKFWISQPKVLPECLNTKVSTDIDTH